MHDSYFEDLLARTQPQTPRVNKTPGSNRRHLLRKLLKNAIISANQAITVQSLAPKVAAVQQRQPIQILADTLAENLDKEAVHHSTVDLIANLMNSLIVKPRGRR